MSVYKITCVFKQLKSRLSDILTFHNLRFSCTFGKQFLTAEREFYLYLLIKLTATVFPLESWEKNKGRTREDEEKRGNWPKLGVMSVGKGGQRMGPALIDWNAWVRVDERHSPWRQPSPYFYRQMTLRFFLKNSI